MSIEFFFTKEDYEALCKKISEIEEKVKKYTASVGQAVDSSGDAWHDANLYYAQGMSESWSKNLRELLEIKQKAHIIKMSPPRDGKVRFGTLVRIRDIESGEVLSYEISSYMVYKSSAEGEKRRISYMSPLGKLLLGAEPGEIREGIIGDNKKKFKILEVE